MRIQEILARRSDLSTFLVHLSRSFGEMSARKRLESIILGGAIEAGSPFGHAVSKLKRNDWPLASQHCVCFTETPLEHVSLLTQEIEGRQIKFEPYGVVITKKQARRLGVNPVWYLDMTPGHDWLTTPLNALIDRAFEERTSTIQCSRLRHSSSNSELVVADRKTSRGNESGGLRKLFHCLKSSCCFVRKRNTKLCVVVFSVPEEC